MGIFVRIPGSILLKVVDCQRVCLKSKVKLHRPDCSVLVGMVEAGGHLRMWLIIKCFIHSTSDNKCYVLKLFTLKLAQYQSLPASF